MRYKNIIIDGVLSDLSVDDGIITDISPSSDTPDRSTGRLWALPGLVNMHTHSAMSLLRSRGSGLPLKRWLNEAIFPCEATFTPDDIYRGALDACKEMRHTGTTTFNDMYFSIESTLRAAIETGMHGVVSLSLVDADFEDDDRPTSFKRFADTIDSLLPTLPEGLSVSIAPHSVYAVSPRNLKYAADYTAERGLPYHMHISETRGECNDCLRQHGVSPVRLLDRIGVLDSCGSRFIGAHALWLDDDDIHILGDHHANVVHCPNSNLKLGSGHMFKYLELRDAGVNVTLGTDGAASSDSLDMIEAMKVMSLLQKGIRCDASVLPANEVLKVATDNGYKALSLDTPRLAIGQPANLFLVDIDTIPFKGLDTNPDMIKTDFLNRLIYAANGSVVANCDV